MISSISQKQTKKMSIIHAKSAKKSITRIIYKKDPKTKMGSLIAAIKPKMTNKIVVQNIKSKQEKHSTKEGSKIL